MKVLTSTIETYKVSRMVYTRLKGSRTRFISHRRYWDPQEGSSSTGIQYPRVQRIYSDQKFSDLEEYSVTPVTFSEGTKCLDSMLARIFLECSRSSLNLRKERIIYNIEWFYMETQ